VLTTNDSGRASFFRIMRNHGMSDSGQTPDFVQAGFNYRMTDIQAALVLGQIERLETLIARRRSVAERYDRELRGRFFRKPSFPATGRTNWQSYHIVLDDTVDQTEFLAFLREKASAPTAAPSASRCKPTIAGSTGTPPGIFPKRTAPSAGGSCFPSSIR
jgi:dTDP-4-amino-4,6-dideoxygalactose transaminase